MRKISKIFQNKKQILVGYFAILAIGIFFYLNGMGASWGFEVLLIPIGTIIILLAIIGGFYAASKRAWYGTVVILISSLILGIIFLILGIVESGVWIQREGLQPSVIRKIAFFIIPSIIIILVSVIGGIYGYRGSRRKK